MFNNNIVPLILTLAAALAWLRINDFAAHKGWIDSKLSRKIIHIGTGPIFVVCWLLFPNTPASRYYAAVIPLLITAQFALVGLGIMKDEAEVKAMSRSGDRREILYGPLFYGIIFVLLTVIYWYDSPIGIIGLMILCGGDGLADIFGRFMGNKKLPWSSNKSWMGSLGMLIGGWLLSILILAIFISVNVFTAPLTGYLLPVTLIAIAATIVESLPLKDFDNITITITAVLLGHLLL